MNFYGILDFHKANIVNLSVRERPLSYCEYSSAYSALLTSCYVTVYRIYCNLCRIKLSDHSVQGVEVCNVTARS